MNTIEHWNQQVDHLISNNQTDEALIALRTFAEKNALDLVAVVHMRRGDWAALQEKELVLGETTGLKEEKRLLRYQLLQLRRTLSDRISKEGRASAPVSASSPFSSPKGRGPVNILFVYDPADREGSDAIQRSSVMLRRLGKAEFCDIQQPAPAGERTALLDRALAEAEIIVLLISSHFLASEECFELQRKAMDLSRAKKASLIPVQYRPCDWSALEIARLVHLPRNGRYITDWPNPDEAYLEVSLALSDLSERVRETIDVTAGRPAPLSLDFSALRRRIGNDEIDAVLVDLLEQTDQHRALQDEILRIQRSWTQLKNDRRRNLLDRERAGIEASRIADRLLQLLGELEEGA